MPVQRTSMYGDSSTLAQGGGVVGGTGDAAWYGRNNVGLTLNEWLQKHQNHNNYSIIKQDILHNIYQFNIVSHVFEVDESICCSQFSPKWLQQLMTIVLYPRPYLRYKNTPGLDHIRGVQNTSFYGSMPIFENETAMSRGRIVVNIICFIGTGAHFTNSR